MRGAHRLPTFWGRGGGGPHRLRRRRVRRDCDFLKFAVCCDNNDLEGRNFSARARPLDGLGKRGPKRNERRQAEAKHVIRPWEEKTSTLLGNDPRHPPREQILSCSIRSLTFRSEISEAISHRGSAADRATGTRDFCILPTTAECKILCIGAEGEGEGPNEADRRRGNIKNRELA